MLTESDIIALLTRDGSREDMLREAYRIGFSAGMQQRTPSTPPGLYQRLEESQQALPPL